MEIKVDLQPSDYTVALKHLTAKSLSMREHQRNIRIVMILSMLAGVGLYAMIGPRSFFAASALFSGLMLIAMVFGRQRRRALGIGQNIDAQLADRAFGLRTLSIVSRGLHLVSEHEEHTFYWDIITDISLTPKHFILCISDNAAIAFSRERTVAGDFDSFVVELLGNWRAHKMSDDPYLISVAEE